MKIFICFLTFILANIAYADKDVMSPSKKNIEALSAKLDKSLKFNMNAIGSQFMYDKYAGSEKNSDASKNIRKIQLIIENSIKEIDNNYSFEQTVDNYVYRLRSRKCGQLECLNMAKFLVITETCSIGMGFQFKDKAVLRSMLARCNGR